jgi:hypothetical protein
MNFLRKFCLCSLLFQASFALAYAAPCTCQDCQCTLESHCGCKLSCGCKKSPCPCNKKKFSENVDKAIDS